MSTDEKLERIAQLLPHVFKPIKGSRIRRGFFNNIMLRTLKLKRSHENVRLLKASVKAFGGREVVIHGKCYYAGIPNQWTYRKPLESR